MYGEKVWLIEKTRFVLFTYRFILTFICVIDLLFWLP